MSEGEESDMDDMTTDEIRELLALAAVGALDGGELARLRGRIADRPALQAELAEYEEAAASLADAVAETPPPALRASVLAAIRDVPQSAAPEPPAAPATASAPVVPISAARGRRWTPVAAIAGAAAAAVVAVVGGAVLTRDDGDDGGDGIAAADLVEAPDAVTITFEGQEDGFALVHSAQHNAVALIGDEIPELAEQQVYELWLIQGDTREPMEIFAPDDDGEVEVVIPDMAPPEGATFAITIEPPGGSEQPTSTAIATTA